MDYDKELGDIGASRWFYLPKIGEESITITIKSIEKKVANNPKFNFTRKVKVKLPDGTEAEKTENLGYQMEAVCADGRILSISSLGAFLQVFRKNNIQEGDTVTIKHIDKGVWEVSKKETEIDLNTHLNSDTPEEYKFPEEE